MGSSLRRRRTWRVRADGPGRWAWSAATASVGRANHLGGRCGVLGAEAARSSAAGVRDLGHVRPSVAARGGRPDAPPIEGPAGWEDGVAWLTQPLAHPGTVPAPGRGTTVAARTTIAGMSSTTADSRGESCGRRWRASPPSTAHRVCPAAGSRWIRRPPIVDQLHGVVALVFRVAADGSATSWTAGRLTDSIRPPSRVAATACTASMRTRVMSSAVSSVEGRTPGRLRCACGHASVLMTRLNAFEPGRVDDLVLVAQTSTGRTTGRSS